jgi:hypothetical protein
MDFAGSAWSWLAGWTVFLLILASFARTEWGKPVVYWMLWLMIVFLLVTQYSQINTLFFNAGIFNGLGNPGGGTGKNAALPTQQLGEQIPLQQPAPMFT